jgi:hypothetical protein
VYSVCAGIGRCSCAEAGRCRCAGVGRLNCFEAGRLNWSWSWQVYSCAGAGDVVVQELVG